MWCRRASGSSSACIWSCSLTWPSDTAFDRLSSLSWASTRVELRPDVFAHRLEARIDQRLLRVELGLRGGDLGAQRLAG